MNREKILKDISIILRQEIFENDELDISELTSFDDITGWDSFEQVNLLTVIEEKYKMHFDISRVRKMKKVRELIDYICEESK